MMMAQNNFIMSNNLDSNEVEPPTITEKFLPLYRKISGLKKPAPAESTISEDQQSILTKLDKFSQFIDDRMTVHQRQLLAVMKDEIRRILQSLSAMLANYNKMISEKNLSQDLWETRNEVQYFKYESLRLYKQNSLMKKKIDHYEEEFQKYQFEGECKDKALKKMAHKLAKYKARNQVNLQLSRRHKSVIFQALGKSNRTQTQQDIETECQTVPRKIQLSIPKIHKKYSEFNKLNMKTQQNDKQPHPNPQAKSQINNPFLPSRQDRIKHLKHKLSLSNKGRI